MLSLPAPRFSPWLGNWDPASCEAQLGKKKKGLCQVSLGSVTMSVMRSSLAGVRSIGGCSPWLSVDARTQSCQHAGVCRESLKRNPRCLYHDWQPVFFCCCCYCSSCEEEMASQLVNLVLSVPLVKVSAQRMAPDPCAVSGGHSRRLWPWPGMLESGEACCNCHQGWCYPQLSQPHQVLWLHDLPLSSQGWCCWWSLQWGHDWGHRETEC